MEMMGNKIKGEFLAYINIYNIQTIINVFSLVYLHKYMLYNNIIYVSVT